MLVVNGYDDYDDDDSGSVAGASRTDRIACASSRKGTNVVSATGVTARFVCFLTEGLLGCSCELTCIFPRVPGRTFFPNLSKCDTFAAAPLVSTRFVSNQSRHTRSRRSPSSEARSEALK